MSDPVSETKVNPKQLEANNRIPLHLLPPVFLLRTAAVLWKGASKPGRWQWNFLDTPVKLTTYVDAILRHTLCIMAGEDMDEDLKEPHWACIAASCVILAASKACGTLEDDRRKEPDDSPSVMRKYEADRKQLTNVKPTSGSDPVSQ